MWDLYLGLAIMALLGLLAFGLTAAVAGALSRFQRNVLGILLVAAMVLYSRLLWQNTVLAQWLPYSNLIVIGNWFPLFLAALGGIVMQSKQLARPRRAAVVMVIGGFASFALALPLL